MKIHEDITLDRIMHAIACDDNLGFCTVCGAEQDGCEPDARGYRCDSCDAPAAVYGAEELLLHVVA
jgi:hypothetical protein